MNERRPKRRWLRVSIALVVVAASLFFALPLIFAPPQIAPADVILHLAIDSRLSGDQYVAELYSQGIAQHVICASSQVSWETYPADYARQHLILLGVRAEDTSVLHLPTVECSAKLLPHLSNYLKEHGWKNIQLIVDPTITRYERWRMQQHFSKLGLRVGIAFAPVDRAEIFDRWWHTHWKAQRIVLSLMNLGLDLLYPSCR